MALRGWSQFAVIGLALALFAGAGAAWSGAPGCEAQPETGALVACADAGELGRRALPRELEVAKPPRELLEDDLRQAGPDRAAEPGVVVVVVDPLGQPISGATVTCLDRDEFEFGRTDPHGECRIGASAARAVLAAAPGWATAETSIPDGRPARLRVALAPAAKLRVTVCDDRGRAVPNQPVDLQLLHADVPVSALRRQRLQADGQGELLVEHLARADYVVRCIAHGRWLGAVATVNLGSGALMPLRMTVPTVSEVQSFEVVVEDSGGRLRWRDGECVNYVLELADRAPMLRIRRQLPTVVAGDPGELLRVRLVELRREPESGVASEGEWVMGCVGQSPPVVLAVR